MQEPKNGSSGGIDYSGGDDASHFDLFAELEAEEIEDLSHLPEVWETPKEMPFSKKNPERLVETLIEDMTYIDGFVPPVCRKLADGELETPPSTRQYPSNRSGRIGFHREALLLKDYLDPENHSSDDEIRKQVAEAAKVQESDITPTPFLEDDDDPIILYPSPSETDSPSITEGEPPQRIDEGEEVDIDEVLGDKGIVIPLSSPDRKIPAHHWKVCLAVAILILGLTSELLWISASLTPAATMPTAPPTTILPSPVVVASIQTVKTYTHCRFFNGDRPVGSDGRHIIVCDEGIFTADIEYEGNGVMKFYNFTPYN